MKILTNYHTDNVGGIARVLSSFIEFIQADDRHKINIIGVELSQTIERKRSTVDSFTLIRNKINLLPIAKVIKSSDNLEQVRAAYKPVVDLYEALIKSESPDLILINGTFFIPWCLLTAARKFKLPIIVHYHGSLSKETAHWDPKSRNLFKAMEKEFDSGRTHYIFPSNLSREVVEKEVFGHKIKNSVILQNPVPLHFFDSIPKKNRNSIGMVARKNRIKNPGFLIRLAKYNAKQKNNFEINIISDAKVGDKYMKSLDGLVNFVKPVKNAKLSKFYARMGVIISPSFFETYGNVPKEALASGIPALISSKMGVAETFIELGLEDWIVDFRSVKDVYKKIREISGTSVDPSVRDKIKAAYSPTNIHKRMVDIIKAAS